MNRPAKAQLHLSTGQFIRDIPGVRQRARKAIELRYDQRVAGPARRKCLPKPRSIPLGAGQAVIDVDAIRRNAECIERVPLSSEILLVG